MPKWEKFSIHNPSLEEDRLLALLNKALKLMSINLTKGKDKMVWSKSRNGNYSVKTTYVLGHGDFPGWLSISNIWIKKLTPKIGFFFLVGIDE